LSAVSTFQGEQKANLIPSSRRSNAASRDAPPARWPLISVYGPLRDESGRLPTMSRRTRLAIAVAVLCTVPAPRAQTPEIRVLMSGAFTAAFTELAPEFERTSASRIVTKYGGSMGNSPETIPNRLGRGGAGGR